MTIVRSHYRYKRPPRKRPAAAPIEGSVVLTISAKTRKRVRRADDVTTDVQSDAPTAHPTQRKPQAGTSPHDAEKLAPPSTDSRTAAPTSSARATKSAIVTAHKPGKRYVEVPEVTPEEHQRRRDIADAMMQEFKRVIAEKIRS